MQKAVDAIGERYAQNSFIWVGKGAAIMTYPIDFGETMNIVAINSSYDNWMGAWVQTADYETIENEFAAWGPHVKKIIKLLDDPSTQAWSMWDDPIAPTFWKDNVCMLGDAAHATTPFQVSILRETTAVTV
jgi:salicylate hydroxylase